MSKPTMKISRSERERIDVPLCKSANTEIPDGLATLGMRPPWLLSIILVAIGWPSAQAVESETPADRVFDVEVGVELQSALADFKNLHVSFVLPRQWPEQDVAVTKTDASPGFRRLKIVDRPPGARQVTATLRRLERGKAARLVYHLRVTRRSIGLPDHPSRYVRPSNPPTAALGSSPLIEVGSPRVIRAARDALVDDSVSAWDQVRQLDAAAKRDVFYSGVAPLKGALTSLTQILLPMSCRSSTFLSMSPARSDMTTRALKCL